MRSRERIVWMAVFMLAGLTGLSGLELGWGQEMDVFEYYPTDALMLPSEIQKLQNIVVKLTPGVYPFELPLRFNAGSNLILEGEGSGFGDNATILDFSVYSKNEEDSRALSVRGGVTVRNLTIRNVGGRVADLRTGTIDAPSDAPVVFENVWFVDCVTGLKSTGGRTVGTPEAPMIVKNCVFVNTVDFPFPDKDSFIDLRDTTYAAIDHCDFYDTDDIVQTSLNDPAAAPNDGPIITIENSILVSNNNPGDDDLGLQAGILTLQNCLLWNAISQATLEQLDPSFITESGTVVGDPLYVNATVKTPAAELDFRLKPGSPASGLGTDGRDAGSIAAEPVAIDEWGVYE